MDAEQLIEAGIISREEFESRVEEYKQNNSLNEITERAVALEIETAALVLSKLKGEQELQTIDENLAIIIRKLIQLGVL